MIEGERFLMQRVNPIWLIVLCAGIMLAINMGIRQGFGLYVKPVSQDLELDRQVFSFAIGLLNLVWGLAAPFAGAVSDKFGATRVVIAGVAAYAIGLLLMANAQSSGELTLSGVLIGLGVAGTGFTAVFGVIARAAPPENRTRALSLATMGSAIGMFIALPYVHVLMDWQGWVTSLVILAATAAFMLPLGLAIGKLANPGAAGQTGSVQPVREEQPLRAAVAEAIKYPSFLMLTAGFFVCGFHIAAVAVHLPSYLSDQGFDANIGAIALTVVGAFNIAGTYLCGRAGEMIPKRVALTIIYLIRGVVFAAMLYLPLTGQSVLIYASILGLVWLGTIPLTSGLIVTFFGPRWLSTLYGIVFLSHQIGSFTGAWLGGVVFDATGSYDSLWWVCIAVSLLAALLHMPIKEAPKALKA
jgi:predicted MFS family arabinose efflux permease